MNPPNNGTRRAGSDINKLIENQYEVNMSDNLNRFTVKFHGPQGTPYENGIWTIRVFLSENYPNDPPLIGFNNKIFHPNIDEYTGLICLHIIGDEWDPRFTLTQVFELFLPSLLASPNPMDPLNADAANLCLSNPEEFRKRIAGKLRRQ